LITSLDGVTSVALLMFSSVPPPPLEHGSSCAGSDRSIRAIVGTVSPPLPV
jgi:hypothetical protein